MLKDKFNRNIRFRFLCVISFALFISTIVLSSIIAWNEGMAFKNSQAANGQSLASFIAKVSKDALVMKDGIQLDAIVNEANKEDIVYTLILDEQDHILTSQYASINYRSPRFTAILSGLPGDIELPEIVEAIKKKESISEISIPIMYDIKPIGKITIGVSDYRIRQQIEKASCSSSPSTWSSRLCWESCCSSLRRKSCWTPSRSSPARLPLLEAGISPSA